MTMMRVDFWATERERAEVMPNGVRVLRSDGIRPGAKCWNPKAIKPTWSYSFHSVKERERMIAETIKAQRRTEAVTGDVTLADPGTVFRYSWGYDQTQVEYFEVVRRRGLLVDIERVACERVDDVGPMSEMLRPVPGAFLRRCVRCHDAEDVWQHDEGRAEEGHRFEGEAPITKRITFTGGRPHISFAHGVGSLVEIVRFANADPLVVESHYHSWYARRSPPPAQAGGYQSRRHRRGQHEPEPSAVYH